MSTIKKIEKLKKISKTRVKLLEICCFIFLLVSNGFAKHFKKLINLITHLVAQNRTLSLENTYFLFLKGFFFFTVFVFQLLNISVCLFSFF